MPDRQPPWRRARPGKPWPALGATCCAVGALAASLILPVRPLLLWNASASMPRGLYAVRAAADVQRGATVAAWAPAAARRLAAARGYLPEGVPLLKRVAAVGGDRICGQGHSVTVAGRRAATRLARDPLGRPLPHWTGCRRLRRGEFLLLSPGPGGFDGRYFGVTHRPALVGAARLLWAR